MKTKSKETDPVAGRTRRPDDLVLAHQVHTLAQRILQHIGSTNPSVASPSGAIGWPPPTAFPFTGSFSVPPTGAIPSMWPCP